MKKILVCLFMLLQFAAVMGQQVSHTVQRGETLESIAKKYNVSVYALQQANPDAKDLIYTGMKLIIPNAKSTKNNRQKVQKNIPSESNYSQAKETATYISNSNENVDSEDSFLENDGKAGGVDIQYHAIENGWGVGLNWVAQYLVFGFDYYFGKTGGGVRTNMGMEIYLGGNYRYYVTENFYVEGRIIGGYYQWDIKFDRNVGAEDQSIKEAFIGLSPRAGLKFGKVAISAGYRWDWIKMKFKKENCLDRFNVGLTFDI